MTEQISLNLTLEELEIIDKYIELNDNTQQLFDKIKEAYPKFPKSPVEEAYRDRWEEYLPTAQSVDNNRDQCELMMWRAFQVGYSAGTKNGNDFATSKEIINKPEKKQSKTLTDIAYDWWSDVFTTHSDWDMETSIEDLVDQVEQFLPKPQSSAGSQNVDVEFLVDGFNDCLNKIKGKLR